MQLYLGIFVSRPMVIVTALPQSFYLVMFLNSIIFIFNIYLIVSILIIFNSFCNFKIIVSNINIFLL